MGRWLLGAGILASVCLQAAAAGLLIPVGGGQTPPAALRRLVDAAGGAKSSLVVISWAGGSGQAETAEWMKAILLGHGAGTVQAAPASDQLPAAKAVLLEQIARATGFFFTGGDQNRIMAVLADTEISNALAAAHARGAVLAGTSAGAAFLSETMITGNKQEAPISAESVDVARGLGVTFGILIDQHFLARGRIGRLMSALLAGPERMGLGIDEDTAVILSEGRHAEVVGNSQALFIRERKGGGFDVRVLLSGARYDLSAL